MQIRHGIVLSFVACPGWPVSHIGKFLIFLSCIRLSLCFGLSVDCLLVHEILDITKPTRSHILFMIVATCKLKSSKSLRSYVYSSLLIVENIPLYPWKVSTLPQTEYFPSMRRVLWWGSLLCCWVALMLDSLYWAWICILSIILLFGAGENKPFTLPFDGPLSKCMLSSFVMYTNTHKCPWTIRFLSIWMSSVCWYDFQDSRPFTDWFFSSER